MSSSNRQASVVIPSHGGAELLPTIVGPLLADPATLEVVVVADRDEAVERTVAAIAHPNLRCVRADAGADNPARQIGVEAARGEVVVLLDDDVLARPGLVTRHLAHDHTRRLVLGYMPIEPRRLKGFRAFPARTYEADYQAAVARWEEDPERILGMFWAGNFSARREDLLSVGLSNPSYRGKYHADNDFGRRLQTAAITACFDRSAASWHLYSRDGRGYVRVCRLQGAGRALDAEPVEAPSSAERLAAKAMLRATYVAALLRADRVERHLLWRLRRIETRVGAYAAQNGRAEAEGLLLPAGGLLQDAPTLSAVAPPK